MSLGEKSMLYGCQYLHEPAFAWSVPVIVDYQLIGTPEQYARKVYGASNVVTSPTLYVGERPAWNLRFAYDQLWDEHSSKILRQDLHPGNIDEVVASYDPDVVFSTIPAPLLCHRPEEHRFSSVHCWAIGDAPEQSVPFTCCDNTVVCNGDPDVGYYRLSNVFGFSTVEWPITHETKPPLANVVKFEKPLSTTCDCFPEIKRLGRYGRWQKGILAHHGYSDAANHLAAWRQR